MLKRIFLLCLGAWLLASSALSAHAGPCDMQAETPVIAASGVDHAHCDMMMADPDAAPPEQPAAPDKDAACCCPAVTAALPAIDGPLADGITFARPASFAHDDRAPSRTLLPEPRPPKA